MNRRCLQERTTTDAAHRAETLTVHREQCARSAFRRHAHTRPWKSLCYLEVGLLENIYIQGYLF